MREVWHIIRTQPRIIAAETAVLIGLLAVIYIGFLFIHAIYGG